MIKTFIQVFLIAFTLLSYTICNANSQINFSSSDVDVLCNCNDPTTEPSENPNDGGEIILSLLVVLLITISTFLIVLLFLWYELNKYKK